MARMEQMELDAQRAKLNEDVKKMVEKYRSIFEWNVPDINQALSDRLIVAAIREALNDVEKTLPGGDSVA
jgi:molybdopterin converting factor small subunit